MVFVRGGDEGFEERDGVGADGGIARLGSLQGGVRMRSKSASESWEGKVVKQCARTDNG